MTHIGRLIYVFAKNNYIYFYWNELSSTNIDEAFSKMKVSSCF